MIVSCGSPSESTYENVRPSADDAGRARGERPVDRAVGGQDAREVELGDRLDDPGAADARHVRAREGRLVRPGVVADHAVAGLERLGIDAHALDRAGRGPLAAADLRALEGRARRARGGEEPIAVAEHDLGVRADVDDQVDLVAQVRPLGEDHARGVGADVARDAGQHVGAGAGMDGEAELGRRQPHRLVDRERERRAAELGRVEAEQEVVHDRVADERDLEDVVARDAGVVRELGRELREAAADRARQLLLRAGMHHHVGDAAHQVLAEADLRVHLTGRGEHLARVQVAEVAGDRRRADVEGDAVGGVVEAGPDARDHRRVVDGDRDRPAARAQGLLQPRQDVVVAREPAQLPLALERLAQAAEVARRRGEIGLLDLDVVEPDDGVDLDRMGVRLLAHDLPVHLALGRHVDHELALDARRAAEPAAGGEPLVGRVGALDRADRREMRGGGGDRVLRVLALADLDLAAPADAAAAADGVDVDAEPAGRVEHGRARLEPPAPPGRREDDEVVGGAGTERHAACRPPPAFPAAAAAGLRRLARVAVAGDPRGAVLVVPVHHVGGPDRLAHLVVQRARDRGGQAGRDRHRQEGRVQRRAVRQAEADVRGAAGRVDAELVLQPAHEPEHLPPGRAHRADRHHERVDDDVLLRDAVVGRARDDLLRDREAHVGILGDARLVVRDRDDRGAVLRDERQHALHLLVLARDGVDERLALVDREPGLERLDDRRVDRERHVGDRLHELDRLPQDRGLVGERDAGVDVEHLRARLDLRDRVGDDGVEVAGLHLLGQHLAAGRVDALADDDERAVEPDHDLLRGRGEDGLGHAGSSSPLARTSRASRSSVYSLSSRAAAAATSASRSSPHGRALAAPLLEVRVGADQAGPHRGRVDRLLEALGQLRAGGAAPLARGHLRRDRAPGDHRQLRHAARRSRRRTATSDGLRARRSPCGAPRTRARGSAAAASARCTQVGVVGLGEVDEALVVAEHQRQQLRVHVELERRARSSASKCRARKSVR